MGIDFFKVFLDKAKSPDPHEQYTALMFALSLPSLCSRSDFPRTAANSGEDPSDPHVLYVGKNGSPLDRRLCVEWLCMRKQQFHCWWLGTMPYECLCHAIYDLRERLVATGSILECANRLVLVAPGCPMMYSGSRIYLSVQDFCQDMFEAASSTIRMDTPYKRTGDFDGVSSEVVDESTYTRLRQATVDAYNGYWGGHGEELRLYQRYCRRAYGQLTSIKEALAKSPNACVFGLTREESALLVKIIEDFEAFDSELGSRLAREFFSTPI